MLSVGVFLFATFIYGTLAYLIKRRIYNSLKIDRYQSFDWKPGHEWALILSPDFWWAIRFKSRAKALCAEHSKEKLKTFVTLSNTYNFWFSLAFGAITLIFASHFPTSYIAQLLVSLAVLRFISRSLEITYAFVTDAFQDSESTTGLTSKERIILAMRSYVEIYFYSAPAYLLFTKCNDAWEAISLSMNIGTLTNVGQAFSIVGMGFEINMVFIQVFTTLSLVILSLASYLSRSEEIKQHRQTGENN
ncbi:hypothetical protein [Pseudomonas sp. SG20052]|uniref:hypothetical protein n=1 Tax=Pseudomonas sp. SG20052 TaxID=3074147 RepID=UPI00287FE809|nr:hypothetical protein [Pseudomonas sp. SG20052]WNF54614.1 hypothetical protein RHP74_25375 [Pseudomonas sp. SG20052]